MSASFPSPEALPSKAFGAFLKSRMPWATATSMLCLTSGAYAAEGAGYVVPDGQKTSVELLPINVDAQSDRLPAPRDAKSLPGEAPGQQVATGSQLGILGNRDALNTPFNVTAYTSKYIADSQSRSIADVTAADPSVRVIFPRASYRDVYSIRGFNLFSYNMGLDGLYGMAPKQRYPAEFAERIEIFKGPDTFINGISLGGSVGGAINIVPKRAADEPVTALTTSYESGSEVGTHLDVGRRLGEENRFGIRFNGLGRGGDTALDDQSEQLRAMALSLDYQGDRLRLYGDFGIQRQTMDSPDWVATLATGVKTPPRVDADTNLGQSWTQIKSKDSYSVLRGEYDLNPDWTAFTSIGYSKTETTGIYVQPTALKSNGDYTGTIRSFPSGGEHIAGQAGLRGQFDTGAVGHNLTLAAGFWNQNLKAGNTTLGSYTSNAYNPVIIAKPDTSALASLDDIHRTSQVRYTSLALADTLAMFDERFQLTLGGREQNIESTNYSAQTGTQTSTYNRSKFSPAVGAVIKLQEHLSLYGNYVEALQQGPSAPSTAQNSGQTFAPVVARQVELGIKVDLDGWFTSLSAFQITQPAGTTDPQSNVYGVDGEQRNRGLEWNVSGEPLAGFRLLGGAMLLDARQVKTAGGIYDGNRAIGVARYQANLGAEWDIPQTPELTLSARAIRTGEQYIDSANTQSIDAWTRYDLGARYALKGLMDKPVLLRLAVENILNKDYWASASAGQVSGVSRGAPRTVLVSSTFSF